MPKVIGFMLVVLGLVIGRLNCHAQNNTQPDTVGQLPGAAPKPDIVAAKVAEVVSKPIILKDTTLDDSSFLEKPYKPRNPRRAAILSAVVPGLGQAYNGKYWKIPIIYAGAIAAIYGYNFNNNYYQQFREAYILRRNGDNTTASLIQFYPDINQLSNSRDYYRYYRDFSVILGVLLYGLQIADAAVDAHLMNFSVRDDLRLAINPTTIPTADGKLAMGIGLQFTLGK